MSEEKPMISSHRLPKVERQPAGPSAKTCESCHTRWAVGIATDRAFTIHVCERCRPDGQSFTFDPYQGYCPVCLTPHRGASCR